MSTPVYVNFGCGANLLPAPWWNTDLDRPDPKDRIDITKPLPFADNSVDRILAEHIVEHVNSADGMRFFLECHRVLKPGGVLRVCVPVLATLSNEERRDICINHGHQQIYSSESLYCFLEAVRFPNIRICLINPELDGHWKQIGFEKDDRETLRMEATK